MLYCDERIRQTLEKIGDELRFVLITSEALLADLAAAHNDAAATEIDGLKVLISESTAEKCVRCWHRRPDVGSDPRHPQLCCRCILNIEGAGETRLYA